MSCQGLGNWKGEPVWIVHLEQRPDRPGRLRQYQTKSGTYSLKIKGRALVAANSFQVRRLETELMEPVPPIRLETELIRIEYAPARFSKSPERLWLPVQADAYVQVYGRRYHQQHQFGRYQLFTVDTRQKVGDPKEP